MLKHLKTISSMLLVAALVASCGSKKSTPKAMQDLEAKKEKILAAYKQLLDTDPDEMEFLLEIRALEWNMPEHIEDYWRFERYGAIINIIEVIKKDISSPSPSYGNYNVIPRLYCRTTKAPYKSGEEKAGLEKELAWFELLKERYKYKFNL